MAGGIVPAQRLAGELRRSGFTGSIVVGGRSIYLDPSLVDRIGADFTAANGLLLLQELRRRRLAPGTGSSDIASDYLTRHL